MSRREVWSYSGFLVWVVRGGGGFRKGISERGGIFEEGDEFGLVFRVRFFCGILGGDVYWGVGCVRGWVFMGWYLWL